MDCIGPIVVILVLAAQVYGQYRKSQEAARRRCERLQRSQDGLAASGRGVVGRTGEMAPQPRYDGRQRRQPRRQRLALEGEFGRHGGERLGEGTERDMGPSRHRPAS